MNVVSGNYDENGKMNKRKNLTNEEASFFTSLILFHRLNKTTSFLPFCR